MYDDIRKTWEKEKEKDSLQDLEDHQLGMMVNYLSTVRRLLAETPSENHLQVDLLTQEGLNIEFMMRDLLMIRRTKIMNAVFRDEKPMGVMTIQEEGFYDRLSRGMTDHSKYVEDVLLGQPAPTLKRSTKKEKTTSQPEDKIADSVDSVDDLEYVVVRFLRPVEEPFMGLDEIVYGPFQVEDTATIPTENAKAWLVDGTVVRVVISNVEVDE